MVAVLIKTHVLGLNLIHRNRHRIVSEVENLHSFAIARHQVLPIVVKCEGLDRTGMLHIDHLVLLVHLIDATDV